MITAVLVVLLTSLVFWLRNLNRHISIMLGTFFYSLCKIDMGTVFQAFAGSSGFAMKLFRKK